MHHSPRSPWGSRLLTFVLAALMAASAVYWALRWPRPARSLSSATPAQELAAPDAASLSRLLGQAASGPAVADPAGRFALIGVLGGPGPRGAALVAVDGKPAKPVRVGALVADDLWLQSVSGRRAVLARGQPDGPAAMTLEMKPLAAAGLSAPTANAPATGPAPPAMSGLIRPGQIPGPPPGMR